MSPYLTFTIIYVLTGIVRTIYDIKHDKKFFKTNPLSIAIVILSWPIWPLKNFLLRKMNFKLGFTLYFVPLFYGTLLYIATISGLSKMYSIENLYSKILRLSLILFFFCGVIWWFSMRRDKIIEKIYKTDGEY